MAQITKAERKILDAAMKRLDRCIKAEDENRKNAIDDLRFANGNQWDSGEKKRRADRGRPALQFNLLPKFIDQVVGDMLHNSPQVKVHPIDSKADPNIAKIRQGIISNIEYLSNSKAIYGYAARQMVTCGYGAWRVLTRYTEENPFLQEAYLEAIRNPFLVYMDPDSKDQNYADAEFGFVLEKMRVEDFREKYPSAQYAMGKALKQGTGLGSEHWYDGETITIAEYFTVEHETVTMCQLSNGDVVTEEEFNKLHEEWQEKADKAIEGLNPMSQGGPSSLSEEPRIAKKRDTKQRIVKQRIITAMEILDGGAEGNTVAGRYIPVVMVKGKELNIEGKNHVIGLIRHAKDPQKMFNYWQSAAAETIALAPKTPWIGTAKQFEGYENDYAQANIDNFPFLAYNYDPDAPGPPQRVASVQPPVAIFQQINNGEATIKSVIGMFNSDLGDAGPERTGAAIVARQKPGDISTFEFIENMARAVLYTGKILNSMIPDLYDSERDVRIRNIDESETFVPINTTVSSAMGAIQQDPQRYQGIDPDILKQQMMKDGKEAKFNDVTVGKYDIVVTTGPSYATQRQESAQHLLQLVQAMPQQMSLASDLIIRNLDFKDSDELADRIRKTLPPTIVKPKPGEQPVQQPPNPAMIKAQAQIMAEQNKAKIVEMKVQQEQIRLQERAMMLKEKEVQLQITIAKAQAEQGINIDTRKLEAFDTMKKHQLDERRQNLEEAKFMHQTKKDTAEFGHKVVIDHAGLSGSGQ